MRQLISLSPEMAGLLLANAKARGVTFNQIVRDIIAEKYCIAPHPPRRVYPPRNKRKISHAQISQV